MDYILLKSVAFGILSYSFLAKYYVTPKLLTLSRRKALIPLLFPHTLRYIGLAFLIPGVTSTVLDSRFAIPAAYGDLLAAVLALIAIFALQHRWRGAIGFVWIFNIVGTLDLLNAIYQATRHVPDAHLGAMYLIPALFVPLLIVSHILIFVFLLKKLPD